MSDKFTRRNFLASAVVASAAFPFLSNMQCSAFTQRLSSNPTGFKPLVQPFHLHDVRLLPGPCLSALEVNRTYMLGLDPDRLLHSFRITAGLPSTASPYGGWEAPVNELRGHFEGHYLSACALMYAQTGDEVIRTRGKLMIAELAKCQEANGGGYLSAFPRELFDRLSAGKRVWAPFYTYHKIMAGLFDCNTLMDDNRALAVLKGMAAWTRSWAEPLSDAQLQKILNVEHGGMTEVLYNLGSVTDDQSYIELGHRFDHERILGPLAAGRDELTKVHGNTNIPKIIGAARRYEITAEPRSHDIAQYFWNEIALKRSYATGGSTSGESWEGNPGNLTNTLNGYTQETCVSYNMLKLTRHLFTWSPQAEFADFYERAFFNGILPTQHPADGEKVYYTPLQSGFWKLFGTPGEGFWCCHGSGVENFAKIGDSIYFHDSEGIYVNLFIASEVHWKEKNLRITQQTKFPESDEVTFTISVRNPVRTSLRIRLPYWASKGVFASLNGKTVTPSTISGFHVVNRLWRDGDRLSVRIPMSLHTAPLPGDQTIQAIMYGPLVLAGRMGTEGLTKENLRAIPTPPRSVPEYQKASLPNAPELKIHGTDPSKWFEAVAGKPLEFRTVGQNKNYSLIPLYRLFDERYAVYWKINSV